MKYLYILGTILFTVYGQMILKWRITKLNWTMAMSKFEITSAYPFMSISPAIVFILGVFILNETFTIGKVIGLALIILGTIVTVKL